MKEHIYLFLFLIGLLTMIIKRITFENTKSRVLQKNSLISHLLVDSTHWFGWGISCIDKTQEAPKNLITTRRASKRHLNI